MATAAKPGAGKGPAAAEKTDAPPAKKSKKKLIFIIAVILLIGGGATAYFLMKPAGAARTEEKVQLEIPPKYIALGTFTANLIHEDSSDRYLQVAISIKISKPELEEQIKARNPEILDHVNMLLSSQRPSVLSTIAGKEKLARDIKFQIEKVLGFHKTAPDEIPTQSASAPASAPAFIPASAPAFIPASAPAITEPVQVDSGIEEVLFTSFIIQ